MLFNSFEYLIFLVTIVITYWLTPLLLLRQIIILVGSLYFYMSWSKLFTLMLIALIIFNWILGKKIEQTKKLSWLKFGCVFNLGVLAYFKYMNFFIDNLESFGALIDRGIDIKHFAFVLPLGISFYIFELISYQVDVLRGKNPHEKNLIVFAVFILFFPHLIAGPICRASQFIPQVKVLQSFDASRTYQGIYFFLAGFALKATLADGLAPFVNQIFLAPQNYSGLDNLIATIGFGIQILCDFWGYSLMAIGAAFLFGYNLPPNFNLPYVATSIRDFWRRWHITLSNWLKDYLYIPLGGSLSNKKWKIFRNLFVTMLLGGFWHGASWNFIVWGAIHGLSLVVNRWVNDINLPKNLLVLLRWTPLAWLLTMSTVFVAWIFFRADNISVSITILNKIVTPIDGWAITKLPLTFFELILLFLPLQSLIYKTTYVKNISEINFWKASLATTVLVIYAFGYYADGNKFIYFQF